MLKNRIFFMPLIMGIIYLSALDEVFAQTNPGREAYIEKYKDIAIRQMKRTGIPASIILAQACLESADGTSTLAVKGNNHFGIKCHEWDGPTIRKDDDKRKECFRKYRNAEESFKDHSKFLTERSRYAFLFEYDKTDYTSWAYGLKKAGYATNPKYPQLLIKIIEDYQLYKYDSGKSGKKKKTGRTEISESATNIDGTYLSKSDPDPARSVIERIEVTESYLYRYSHERKIYRNNGKLFIIAKDGDSFKGIAKEYNFFKRELMSFNDRKKEHSITKGEIIYLQKKSRKAKRGIKEHVFSIEDDMYGISQKYGIRLKRLYKMNKIEEGTEPECGTILKLR